MRVRRRTRIAQVTALVAGLAVLLALGVRAGPASGQAGAPVRYRWPVSGPITDPFRPPTSPYGPGNLGIEFAAPPGTPVVAPAEGFVTFAGQVGGILYVVIRHPQGLRSTLGLLATVEVVVGQGVVGGQRVGTSSGRVHWGVRVADVYLDPALLVAAGGRVRLVR